jgi:hypothetical protein
MRRRGDLTLIVLIFAGAGAASGCATTDDTRTGDAAHGAPQPAADLPAPAEPVATATAVVAAPANPWLDPAREVLIQHCGRCHRGDLPTSLPKALAVFDLTRPIWNERLVRPQYDGILTRVRESSAIDPDEVAAVEAFVRCARDGACGAS